MSILSLIFVIVCAVIGLGHFWAEKRRGDDDV